MENIKSDYLQMLDVYKALNDIVNKPIDNTNTLNKLYVNNLVESGRYLTDSLGRLALDVYEELPRNMKDTLFYEKKRIYDKLAEEGWHNAPTYIDRKLEFIYYASSFDICFFKNVKSTTNSGDTIKLANKKDYSLFPIAYKKLNEVLFLHINGTQYLHHYTIECIVSAIKYILSAFNKKSYACFKKHDTEVRKHKEIEDYFNAPISINEGCSLSESDITLLKEHNEWKVKRVKHLQELFPTKRDRFPHDEMYFVKRGIMYNENF